MTVVMRAMQGEWPMTTRPEAVPPGVRPAGSARVFLAWADAHQRQRRQHGAELAQITRHHDLNPRGDAVHQLQAWAARQAQQKHLHTSALAQLRRPASPSLEGPGPCLDA